MDFEKSLKIFQQNCLAKNLSINTIEFYGYALRGLFKYGKAKELTDIEQITFSVLLDYFAQINNCYSTYTFAKLFLLNGGDLFSLQKILGHEDISITRVYVDYNEYELKMQIDRYNPLDNTRWKYL